MSKNINNKQVNSPKSFVITGIAESELIEHSKKEESASTENLSNRITPDEADRLLKELKSEYKRNKRIIRSRIDHSYRRWLVDSVDIKVQHIFS